MRFFVAMVSHETNTFSPIPTDRRQFEAHDLHYGGELLEAYRGTGTCLGGMIDTAEARGVTLVPSLAATASPAGRVSKDFYAARQGTGCWPISRPRARWMACCSICMGRWSWKGSTTARGTCSEPCEPPSAPCRSP